MLADVQLKLEAVRDNVKALRALVSETQEPSNPPVVPPLPAPGEPLTNDDTVSPTRDTVQDVLHIDILNTPLDTDTDMEDDVEEWQTVQPMRRKRKEVLLKLKGTPSQSKRESFSDMSGRDIARALAQILVLHNSPSILAGSARTPVLPGVRLESH